MGVRIALAALLFSSTAFADPPHVVEKIAGADVDFTARTITLHAAGAPSLDAPNAAIARVQAERKAHDDVARALKRFVDGAGKRLGCQDPSGLRTPAEVARDAKVSDIDYGSDGSVKLAATVTFGSLLPASTLVGGRKVILVDASAFRRPRLFAGDTCEAAMVAPALFETAADARASDEGKDAVVVDKEPKDGWVAAIARKP